MSSFYLTLPSNSGNIKYFSNNKNNSWKNRLETRSDLESEWGVGLNSIQSTARFSLVQLPEKTQRQQYTPDDRSNQSSEW